MTESCEPFDQVVIDNEPYPVTRMNLALFKHFGRNALYDHCYISYPNGKNVYIWAHSSQFDRFAQLAVEHSAQIVLNKTNPSDIDKEHYVADLTDDLDDIDAFAGRWLEEQAQ